MPARSNPSRKPLIDNPNQAVASTDDGEEIDNAESGGLTKRTFVIGGSETTASKRRAKAKVLESGAATAESIMATARTDEDDLLPLFPLPGSEPASPSKKSSEDQESEDDLFSLVAKEAETGEEASLDGEEIAAEPGAKKPRRRIRAEDKEGYISPESLRLSSELTYRFPYSRTQLEVLPDMPGTFCIRVAYQRGRNTLSLFQTTPLRSIAEIRCRGQHFPVFLMQHARKRRDRILLGAKRRTANSWRSAVRCAAVVTGRGDRLTWFWRVTATVAALAQSSKSAEEMPPDSIKLALPLAPGKSTVHTLPGTEGRGLAILLNDVAVTVVAQPQNGVLPTVTSDNSGIYLTLDNADLSGDGATLQWETWLTYAKTEAEAMNALASHFADAADRAQTPPADQQPFLRRVMENCERELMRHDIIEKRGIDKNVYQVGPHRSDVLLVGPGVDAALTAQVLLNRFFTTGDEMIQRRVRLLANGVCEFQNSREDSPHWGAIWDALVRKTEWGNQYGRKVVSFTTTARTAKGLQSLQSHFDVELYERTALAAAQWLLLRMERDGIPQGEFFAVDGRPTGTVNPWIAGEALIPLSETFRATKNEVYLKTAHRTIATLMSRVTDSTLSFNTASTEQLAAVIEGVLLISREYEQESMVKFASSIGLALRARRLPDGTISDPTGIAEPVQEDLPLLASTLAGAKAALALTRVDDNILWPIFALRAVRAVDTMLRGYRGYLNVADKGNLLSQAFGVLLAIAARVPGTVADRDKLTLTQGWQTFAPDPATQEYVKVSLPSGDSPDYLALVSPVSQQVLISVLAAPGTESVEVVKNNRSPYLRNLLTDEYDQKANLIPLGDGTEATIGVFLADT